jgi:NAD(P)-dependent dehydrogenase (short-subunit alcohol dehydrogenase family)
MQTIFITGASSGLGKATAKLFQARGWRVIATMRTPEKETELRELANVVLLPLDVTNLPQIEATVQEALALGVIDVVFNNVGYGLTGAFEAYSDEQMQDQLNTNLLGVLRVAKPFVQYFREHQQPALFITTSSAVAIAPSALSSVYSASKWALEGWTEAMAYDLAAFNIGFKTVAPGGIKTNFGSTPLVMAEHEAYAPLLNKLMAGFQDGSLIHFSEPEAIAEVVYEAATDGKSQLRYFAGPDAAKTHQEREQLGAEGQHQTMLERYRYE